MMYSEFLTLSGMTEDYISYTEYTNEIEPVYTGCELSKADFINLLKKSFEMIVYPAVEKAIHKLPTQDKEMMAFDFNSTETLPITDKVQQVDREARKVAYGYIRIFSQL